MATAYSDEVAVGSYNRIRLRVEYNGTSATCYMEFRRTSSYSGTWADSQASITFNGVTVAAPYSYSGTVGTSWVQLCNASGFSVSISGGTYSWDFNNPGGSSVLGCSGSIVIGAQGSAPTDLSLSNIAAGPDNFSATVSVSGWGGIGDATTRYRELDVWAYDTSVGGGYRRYQKARGDSLSSTIIADNGSETESGKTMNIVPNTRYTLTSYASNGSYDTGMTNATNAVTLPAVPIVNSISRAGQTVTTNYTIPADGGFYDKTVEYSIDGGTTWTTVTTISSGSAYTSTFNISSLPAGNTTVTLRSRTTAGSSSVSYYASIPRLLRLYGSVSSVSEEVGKLYGSVNGTTKKITKLYGSANGVTELVYTE